MGGAAYLAYLAYLASHDCELFNMAELIRACESGNLDALKKLIKNGKSPRGIRTDDSCCDTLLHIACRFV